VREDLPGKGIVVLVLALAAGNMGGGVSEAYRLICCRRWPSCAAFAEEACRRLKLRFSCLMNMLLRFALPYEVARRFFSNGYERAGMF
jgi:hypothetical protein